MRILTGVAGSDVDIAGGDKATVYAIHLPTGDKLFAESGVIPVRVLDGTVGLYRVHTQEKEFRVIRLEASAPLMPCVRCGLFYDPLKPKVFGHCRWHPKKSLYPNPMLLFSKKALRNMTIGEYADRLEDLRESMLSLSPEGAGNWIEALRESKERIDALVAKGSVRTDDLFTQGLNFDLFKQSANLNYGFGPKYEGAAILRRWTCCEQPEGPKTLGCFIGEHSFHKVVPDLHDFHNHSRGTEHYNHSHDQRPLHAKISSASDRNVKLNIEAAFNSLIGGTFYPDQLAWRLDLQNIGVKPGDLPDADLVRSPAVTEARTAFQKSVDTIVGRFKNKKIEWSKFVPRDDSGYMDLFKEFERNFDGYPDARIRRLKVLLKGLHIDNDGNALDEDTDLKQKTGYGVLLGLNPIFGVSDEEKLKGYAEQMASNLYVMIPPRYTPSFEMVHLARTLDNLIDSIFAGSPRELNADDVEWMQLIRGENSMRKVSTFHANQSKIRQFMKRAYGEPKGTALSKLVSYLSTEIYLSSRNSTTLSNLILKLIGDEIEAGDESVKIWDKSNRIVGEATKIAKDLESKAFLDWSSITSLIRHEGAVDAGLNKHLLFSCAFSFYHSRPDADDNPVYDSLFARILVSAKPKVFEIADRLFDSAVEKIVPNLWKNLDALDDEMTVRIEYGGLEWLEEDARSELNLLQTMVRFSIESDAQKLVMRYLFDMLNIENADIEPKEKVFFYQMAYQKISTFGAIESLQSDFIQYCFFFESVSRRALPEWATMMLETYDLASGDDFGMLRHAMNRVESMNVSLYKRETGFFAFLQGNRGYLKPPDPSALAVGMENASKALWRCQEKFGRFPGPNGWIVDMISIKDADLSSAITGDIISVYNSELFNQIHGGALKEGTPPDIPEAMAKKFTVDASKAFGVYKKRRQDSDKKISRLRDFWDKLRRFSTLSPSFTLFCASELERGEEPETWSEKWNLARWLGEQNPAEAEMTVDRVLLKVRTVVAPYNKDYLRIIERITGSGIAPLEALIEARGVPGEYQYAHAKEVVSSWAQEQAPVADNAMLVVSYQCCDIDLTIMSWCIIDDRPNRGAFEFGPDRNIIRGCSGPYPEIALMAAAASATYIERPVKFGAKFTPLGRGCFLYKSGLDADEIGRLFIDFSRSSAFPGIFGIDKEVESAKLEYSELEMTQFDNELETLEGLMSNDSRQTPEFKYTNGILSAITKRFTPKKKWFYGIFGSSEPL